jgi:hypothetical protein
MRFLSAFLAVVVCALGIGTQMACAQGFGMPMIPGGAAATGQSAGLWTSSGRTNLEPFVAYVGFMPEVSTVSFGFDSGAGAAGTPGLHRWSPKGVWLGGSETVNLSNTVSFTLDGWYLISCLGRAREIDEFPHSSLVITGFEFDGEILVPVFGTVFDTVLGHRSWNTENIWWFLDGVLNWRVGSGFTCFAGLRYDKFSTRFKDVSTDGIPPSTASDTADITLKSYIPFIGIQQEYRTATTSLSVRFLGFPYVASEVTHFQTSETGAGLRTEARGNFNSAYFFEAFGEYSYRSSDNTSWGIFLRWNQLHARGDMNIEVPGFLNAESGFTVHRPSFTVGGLATFAFNSPF